MRAQVSLQFDDEKLFNEMIKPFKDARILNGLIIKCLSAYFYNDDIKSLIENTNIEEVNSGVVNTEDSTQELFSSIRATLLAQDFLAQELKDTIEEGTSDVTSILEGANKVMKESGMASVKKSSAGDTSEVLQLELKNPRNSVDDSSSNGTGGIGLSSAEFKIVQSWIKALVKGEINPAILSCISEGREIKEEDETVEPVETVREEPKIEVPVTPEKVEPVFEEPHIEEIETAEDDFDEGSDIVYDNDIQESQESVAVDEAFEPQTSGVVEDAASEMGDLLSSLGF